MLVTVNTFSVQENILFVGISPVSPTQWIVCEVKHRPAFFITVVLLILYFFLLTALS